MKAHCAQRPHAPTGRVVPALHLPARCAGPARHSDTTSFSLAVAASTETARTAGSESAKLVRDGPCRHPRPRWPRPLETFRQAARVVQLFLFAYWLHSLQEMDWQRGAWAPHKTLRALDVLCPVQVLPIYQPKREINWGRWETLTVQRIEEREKQEVSSVLSHPKAHPHREHAQMLAYRQAQRCDESCTHLTHGSWRLHTQAARRASGEATSEAQADPDSEDTSDDPALPSTSTSEAVWAAHFRQYDNPAVHQRTWQDAAYVRAWTQAIERLGPEHIRGKTVLDVGCGLGVLTLLCAKVRAHLHVPLRLEQSCMYIEQLSMLPCSLVRMFLTLLCACVRVGGMQAGAKRVVALDASQAMVDTVRQVHYILKHT